MKVENNLFIENTTARIDKGVLHLRNDEFLEMYFKRHGRKFRPLAQQIRREHRERFGEELKITEKSLSCEIFWHYWVYKVVLAVSKVMGGRGIIGKVLRSVRVIDCGDKECDTNRFVWDFLSHFMIWWKKQKPLGEGKYEGDNNTL